MGWCDAVQHKAKLLLPPLIICQLKQIQKCFIPFIMQHFYNANKLYLLNNDALFLFFNSYVKYCRTSMKQVLVFMQLEIITTLCLVILCLDIYKHRKA